MLKSITAKEIFKKHPEIKKQLWGGNIWTSEFYVNTVGQYGNKYVISRYVKNQGKNLIYHKIYENQPTLF